MNLEIVWITVITISIFINSIILFIIINKMKVIKEIFNDHKQNIEKLNNSTEQIMKLLSLKENG